MAEKVSIDYDKENDSVFLYKRGNVKGSIDIGDFIVDLSPTGKILGIEILDASKNFKVSKDLLSNIKKASLNVIYRRDVIQIMAFLLLAKKLEIKTMIPIPISA